MRDVSSSVMGCSKADVACGEPHQVVSGLVAVAGLVAGVGLDQAVLQMCGRGAGEVVVEVTLEVLDDAVAEEAAEPLDRPDP